MRPNLEFMFVGCANGKRKKIEKKGNKKEAIIQKKKGKEKEVVNTDFSIRYFCNVSVGSRRCAAQVNDGCLVLEVAIPNPLLPPLRSSIIILLSTVFLIHFTS